MKPTLSISFVIFSALIILSCESNDFQNKENTRDSIARQSNEKYEKDDNVVPNQYHQHLEPIQSLPENIATFIPDGFVTLDTAFGDFNNDRIKDLVLVICKANERDTCAERPILILLGIDSNQYKLLARNNNAVYKICDNLMTGNPFMGIAVNKGYFSIEHYEGYRDSRDARTITFKYSKETDKFYLYKVILERNIINWDTNNPDDNVIEKVVKVVKTTKDFGSIPFDDYHNNDVIIE